MKTLDLFENSCLIFKNLHSEMSNVLSQLIEERLKKQSINES
jgi:hypothetical protein